MDLRGRWVRVRVVRGLAFAAVLAAVLAAALPAAVAQQDAPYGDIPSGAFYTEPVTTLAARGGCLRVLSVMRGSAPRMT